MDFDKENSIIDAENFRSNQNFGYKQIVLSQVQRVVINLSREQKEGFWIHSTDPRAMGDRIKYVGDARKETIQSIETLYDLLLPKFDKQMQEDSKDYEINLDAEIEPILKRNKQGDVSAIDDFWKIKRKHYRRLFQQLCLFLERIGWLEAGEVEE